MKTNTNITQEEMALFLGVTQQYISLLLKNKVRPRWEKVETWSRKTNTDPIFWYKSSGSEKRALLEKIISFHDSNHINPQMETEGRNE